MEGILPDDSTSENAYGLLGRSQNLLLRHVTRRVIYALTSMAAVAIRAPTHSCIKQYYKAKIEAAELLINQKTQNLRRLEAQRNALNARGMCAVVERMNCVY